MAKVSRRPLKNAIRPIVYEPPTTASFEQSRLLALHNASTANQSVSPQRANAGVGLEVIVGGRKVSGGRRGSGAGKLNGGTFAPRSNLNFR